MAKLKNDCYVLPKKISMEILFYPFYDVYERIISYWRVIQCGDKYNVRHLLAGVIFVPNHQNHQTEWNVDGRTDYDCYGIAII